MLLDFTGRKVDPSLMMGFKENKKDEDPSIKVGFIISLNTDHLNIITGLSSLQTLRFCCASHPSKYTKEGKEDFGKERRTHFQITATFNYLCLSVVTESAPPLLLCSINSQVKDILIKTNEELLFSPDIEDPNDRVEVAFRRLDSDGDGYLDIEDFFQVSKS